LTHKIVKIKIHTYSSRYGNKVFGQPKSVRSGVIIEIISDKNFRGFGESYVSGYLPEISKISLEYFSDYLIGKNLNKIEEIKKLLIIPFCTNNGFLKSIIAAIEIAIFDLKSQIKNVPLYKYLNKSFRKSISGYASGGSVVCNNNDIYKDFLMSKKIGLEKYKLRIGYQSFKMDLKRINYALQLFGRKNVMVDAIMGTLNKWEKNQFIKKLAIFNRLDLKWIEEPLHPSKTFDYKEITKKSVNPIALGEAFTSYEEFKILILNNCCDIIQPDVTQCGILDTIKICKLAKKYKKKISLHVWGSSLSFLVNLHFALAFKEVDIIEYPLVNMDILKNIVSNNYKTKKNKIYISSNMSGIGIYLKKNYFNQFKFIKKSGFSI
tara:strand:- start:4 stop:1137 length:1134 start_codon:yes stop_codon:yes gene_type:complete